MQQKEKKKGLGVGFRMLSSIAFSRQKTDGVTHCIVPSVVGQALSKPTSHYLFKWRWNFLSTDSAVLHSCSNVFILDSVYICVYFFLSLNQRVSSLEPGETRRAEGSSREALLLPGGVSTGSLRPFPVLKKCCGALQNSWASSHFVVELNGIVEGLY